MYLKKLSIQGFKSFATATDLNFDPGITAIVGPNGCGKSNIVDALRWVIGEQRARVLRSDKMDSIIFNGTAHRRAVGLAEVQLTIANTRGVLPVEYSEVTLGRRLYRSGEAEYLLNGVSCRLRDITDLFTDTGMGAGAYSVIELKMIDEILSENTQDRRRLFEEASGITRYKKRRTDALRKLDHMQADLARVQDLTDEISTRVRSLKRQAGIAERYLRYKTELRTAQITLLKVDYARLVAEESVLTDEATKASDICAGLTAKVHTCETQLEDLRARFLAQEKRAKANRQEFVDYEQYVIKLEGNLQLEEAKRQTIAQNLKKLVEEQKAVNEELQSLDAQQETVGNLLADAVSEAGRSTEVFNQVASERASVQTQLKALEHEGEVLGVAAQDLNQKKVNVQRQADQLQSRIFHVREEERRLESEWNAENEANKDAAKVAAQACTALEEVKKKRDHARADRQATETSHAILQKKIAEAESTVQLAEKHLAAKQAEIKILEDLVSTYDFFPDAVRYLLTNTQDLQITTLSDLISCVPEKRSALAASLEPYGGCIIAGTEDVARTAARQLRSEDVGRAYFIILENIPSLPLSGEIRSDALLSHIHLRDETYRPIVNLLLQDVLLVDSLDTALSLLKQSEGRAHRYVTLDGEWVDGRGMLYAGGREEGGAYSHLARRDSLRVAGETYQELQEQAKHARMVLAEMRATQDQLDLPEIINQARTAEQLYAEADRKAQKYVQIQELGSNQLATIKHRRKQLAQEIDQLEQQAQPSGDQLSHMDQELACVKEQLQSAEDNIQIWRGKLDQIQNTYVNANATMVQAVANRERLEADVERIGQEKLRLNMRVIRHCEEQEALKEMQKDSIAKVDQLTETLQAEHSGRTHWEKVRTEDSSREHELRIELEQTNERVRKARRALQEANQEETSTRVRYSAVQARREDLLRRAVEDYGVEFSETPEIDGVDDATLREQIQDTERKLQSMGNVNALALEEYEKQNERLEFMLAQCADLEEAEQTLVRTIKEINSTASRQFLDTYVLIQKNFQKIFCELFGEKAKCELDLTMPDDVLESPIAVTARPSGKRPVSIAQLSSGEKTLTAIALLFAIYLIKPSPFCFLDEVDAPLDDINVDHFMRIIHRFSSETQFVLVTHNKRTMEMANCLYGVTMQEEGVSNLVSVRFDEAVAIGSAPPRA